MKKILLFLLIIFASCNIDADIEIPMAEIRGGTFSMGEIPETHEVCISDFLISKYEITIKQWIMFCDESDYDFDFQNHVLREFITPPYDDDLQLPIISVTWVEAIQFCNWLSRKEKFDEVYEVTFNDENNYDIQVEWDKEANGFRLPTEAEWEYAARGNSVEENIELDKIAWYLDNSDYSIHQIGLLTPNSSGLYDVLGNALEWCYDYFAVNYYQQSERDNPAGPDTGFAPNYFENPDWENIARVVRGGSFSYPKEWVNVYIRAGVHYYQRDVMGFRVVRNSNKNDASSEE